MVASRRHHHEPLPLETRRVLWHNVWDRLLAPPPLAGDRGDDRPSDLGGLEPRTPSRGGES